MKIFKSVILAATIIFAFLSCQKELVFNNDGVSKGVFKKDASGNCLPVVVNGLFKVDTVLTNAVYVDIQVNVTTPGTFDMRTDTVNGYAFSKVGSVVFGLNTVRLYAAGKPIAAGKNTFTVKYSLGTGQSISTCNFDITVTGPAAPQAIFTLGGDPGACTGAVAGGTYIVGVPLTPANTLTIQVNVAIPGTYVIAAATTNGFTFSGAGVFISTGLQNVTLTGSGTPLTAGNTTVNTANGATSACTFNITVQPVAPPAVFTLDGAPNGCTGFTLNGTYAVNIATAATNTVTLNVNVTTLGTYTISTNTMNGITFSKTGIFTTTGSQPVTLTATGTPTAAGPFVFSPTVGASTCTFTVTVQPPPPPAAFTLSGAPGACAPITVNGTYTALSPLGATNTAVVEVNVTTPGIYTLTTNTVNGMTFSNSGVFTATGLQNVTLKGTGTPAAAQTSTLTPQIGTSSCTFSVVVTASPDGVLTCKINNVPFNFSTLAEAYYIVPNDLTMSGKSTAGNGDDFVFGLDKSGSGNPVITGTYVNTLAGSIAGLYILSASYFDAAASIHWSPASIFAATPDPFTIIITQVTATRIKGTFSGTIREVFGSGPNTKTVTEGVFDLPIH